MRRTAGFTLLEIAVALAVLGVGVVTCFQMFGGSLRIQDRAMRETRAVVKAREKMDALLVKPPEELADYHPVREEEGGFTIDVLNRPAGPEEGLDERALEVQSEVALLYLEVDVTWQDGAGSKTYALGTMRLVPRL